MEFELFCSPFSVLTAESSGARDRRLTYHTRATTASKEETTADATSPSLLSSPPSGFLFDVMCRGVGDFGAGVLGGATGNVALGPGVLGVGVLDLEGLGVTGIGGTAVLGTGILGVGAGDEDGAGVLVGCSIATPMILRQVIW